LVEIFQGGLET